MSALQTLLDKAKAATPRERAGVALVAALVLSVLASSTFDWAMQADAQAREAAQRHTELSSVQSRIGDQRFQEEVALAAGKVWRWSVTDASESLAAAQASSTLEALAAGVGLSNVSVSAAEAGAGGEGEGLGAIRLTLRADFDWAAYMALLQALEASELSLVVDATEMAGGADAPRTLMVQVRIPLIREAEPS